MVRPALEDILPLSPMQEGMLFHSLLDPDGGVDFEQLLYRLDGVLDTAALSTAWQSVVARHAALRARLRWQGVERPLQLIEREVTVPVTELDWSDLAAPDRAARLESWLEQDRAAGFTLSRAPLLRIALVRTAPAEHLMVMSFHHAILDGWSVRLVLREVMACYRSAREGRAPELEPAPPFASFLRWLGGRDEQEAARYWAAELGGVTSPTQVVGERRTGLSGFAAEGFALTREESERLRAFARTQRVTVNTLVQGAWGLLLSRYSGDRDVVFGATMSLRPAEVDRVEAMVGLMINTLPMKVHTDPDARVGGWLREVQDAQLRLRQFDYTPLVEAQRRSGVPKGTPLFDTLLVFENYPAARPEDKHAEGLELTAVGAVERNGYPLSVVAAIRDLLRIEVTYDRQLFDQERIGRLTGHLRTLLTGLIADPDARLGDVPMLTAPERELLVHGWNDTRADYPSEACVHQLFERQAAAHPERPALHDFDGSTLSYGELNARANRLAHHLRALGAGPERCVGLCATPSVAAVIGILGILKSGAAYVPLDPEHPAQRLGFMLGDTAAALVVSEQGTAERLPAEHRERAVVLDARVSVAAGLPETDPTTPTRADGLAYVMYTSGSTGRPKGVLVPHRGLVNYLWWCIEGYGLQGASGAPMLGSIAADLGMPNYLLPLIGGRDVTLLPAERSLDSLRERLLVPGDFSLLKITPGHIDVLRSTLGDQQVDSVRTFVIGADEVKPETMAAWRKIAPGSRVINEYGPTETVVGCSIYLAGDDFDPAVPVPIGRPIANTFMYVLDDELEPVPAGVVGELFIGGDGVARGYLNRPTVTAEKFVPDPFAGGRMYRTGDLARWRADGELEFLGRIDHQVKIRGYRVELGEIEARLLARADVTEAVVVAREDVPGDRRLVAYLVADGAVPETAELRGWLEQALPSYMVPATFVVLPALPLSQIGKVDRGALPAPDTARPDLGARLVAPRTPTERAIAEVWCHVLGLDEVGVHDDFFALGGHSLLATRVVSRLAKEHGFEVPLRLLFEAPTVGELAERVHPSEAQQPAIGPADRSRPLPLSFGQQRLWFQDQLEPGSAEYLVPLAWRLQGPLDVEALRTALARVVARHEVLRTALVTDGETPRQVVSPTVPVELPVLPFDPAAVKEFAGSPFDLRRAPLWRAALFQQAADRHVFVLVLHHSAGDAWSAGVLVRELTAGYRAARTGADLALPELPLQYADFAAWQRESPVHGRLLAGQLEYWRQALAALTPLELPTDRPRGATRATDGAAVNFTVPDNVADQLRRLAADRRVTLFMVLLGCLQVLLARHSGQDDIVVGTPIAGRNRSETEPLVGFFVNTLVLRTDLSGDPTFTELLDRVREVTLGAYEHQDLPFERLVEELHPERDLSRTPLFQVMLSIDTTETVGWNLPDVHAENYALTAGQVKVDLTTAFADTDQGMFGTLRYSTALFDADRITRMATHLVTLLTAVAADPEVRLSQLPLLPPQEYRQVVREWNGTPRPTGGTLLHELVQEQAALRPDAVALISGQDGTELSYGDLDARSNQLAHHLRSLGVGPESLVGICLPRSVEAVLARLAVLKAGGAYLALDPDLPAERLAFMLADTTATTVLTSKDALEVLPERYRERALLVADPDWQDLPAHAPKTAVAPGNAAYVTYTSGSTGRPKGVLTTHANAVSHLQFLRAEYDLGPGDTAVALSGVGFDSSVRETFGALGSGARLVVAPPGAGRDPEGLVELLAAHRVTVVPSVVPSLLYDLAAAPGVPDAVRLVLASGERLRADRITGCGWLHGKVVNQFGPTEATMTTSRVRLGEQDGWRYRVGRPITNAQVYVLDEHFAVCPVGVPGQLCIGGAGVARGYLGRPGLTAERFVPNPFGPGRLYLTGDVCRWSADGELEHLGRSDHQVKLRGFRVEPAEIEARLLAFPGITAAVVTAGADALGDLRLVAHLVAAAAEPSVTAVRDWLAAALPEHLVPAAFVFLPALPLTPNGKVDRSALPEPGAERPGLDAGFTAPRTHWEELVAAIWSQVLGIERIGVHDDFFALGGHSLLATHVVARLRARHGVSLPLRTVFDRPTVAQLAAFVADGPAGREQVPGLVELNASEVRRTLFCVHEGTGSITGYYETARILRSECSLVGIEFDERLVDAAAPDPLSAMAAAYVDLVRKRQPHGPYLLCGWSMGGVVAYEMAAQLTRAGQQVEWVGLVDSVVSAPETANRNRVDRLLDELIARCADIDEQDWNELAEQHLTGHLRQLDLRVEQIGLGKQALTARLRRNRFFREAKRNYRPAPADVPLHVLKAVDGNWDWSFFEAWRSYAPGVEFLEVPGTHLSVMERPQLDRVISWLRAGLRLGDGDRGAGR
ncbi:amino acid adenylation domain-containing protein [Kitasatospora sp. LaBMicrA B282]|uniref:amino acid adenylation domain-containing protein n=1 Tax=Kitasatospora sp. LaBMicrA B282 TaxID=3420949 RepID=UPI003D10CAD8